jgi:hypothetical protein
VDAGGEPCEFTDGTGGAAGSENGAEKIRHAARLTLLRGRLHG